MKSNNILPISRHEGVLHHRRYTIFADAPSKMQLRNLYSPRVVLLHCYVSQERLFRYQHFSCCN